ncbi:kinase-like domain-containing protein [Rhizophagus clarus]|uniref:Kinase-like domain-containing protein n=1 Tax=Rhizophagus clarus TaxID=94130 RepID=A0A8H3M8H1_9GLOM|nr:kinase-like domain-containing protein [Rhizophagus clarus]
MNSLVREILWSISARIYKIHELGLVRSNLHECNVLIEHYGSMLDARITDTGLYGSFITFEEIYAVVQFVVPEIFNGGN